MAWDEDRLHRWLSRAARPLALRGSQGHDACVLTRPKGREVACADQVVSGVHYEPGVSPRLVGRKAALRALSDLAATAAKPRALLLAVRASSDEEELEIRGWIRGVREVGEEYGAELCGGDIACASGPSSLCVTALGEYQGRGRPPGRDRAKGGDWILLTGPVGGSLGGRHLRIQARLAAGSLLHHSYGARALMDVSDGLAWDLYRLARASGVRARLQAVPVHRDAFKVASASGESALWHALHDGEDHELLAVMSPSQARQALRARSSALGALTLIGKMEVGSGLLLDGLPREGDRSVWKPGSGGWRHGR